MADSMTTAQPTPTQPTAGLINTAPGSTTSVPGVTPTGSTGPGAPVTSYTPQTATASTYQATPYTVDPNQTTAGQIQNIISSGSPLMQQAVTNANNLMNERGLINSSIGVGAAQSAVIGAAEPIAANDANIYASAGQFNAGAKNTAAQFGAEANNTASQFNATQSNTALGKAADASNTESLTAQQIAGQTNIQQIQSDTQKTIANIQANTTLSAQDKQDQTQTAITAMNNAVSTYLGQLQSNTQLSLQDKSAAAAQVLATMNNASAQAIASIQSDTSLSVADKQAAESTLIASMNNQNAQIVQQMQNDSSLQNIMANGVINTQITNLTDQNRLLLQSSSGASTLYNQALSYMSQIATDVNLSADDKAAALNNAVTTLNDALAAMGTIAGTPSVTSLLNFAAPTTATTGTTGATGTTATGTTTGYSTNNTALMQLLGGSLSGGAGGNSTPLQDIARAISQGQTITDGEWAQAGLPSGGGTTGQQLYSAILGTAGPTSTTTATNPLLGAATDLATAGVL